jgi:predicted nicotinamide N-methyase
MDPAEQESTALPTTTNESTKDDAEDASSDKAPPKRIGSSPTARAFFAALDDPHGTVSTKSTTAFIQKRVATLGWRNRHSQSDQYPMRLLNSNKTFHVQQVQRGECENTYGTGATVWPASLVLMRYLERHAATLMQGKRVIDLGSGTGITSIAAALLGAQHVICTDGEASVVQLARQNIANAAKELRNDELDNTFAPASGSENVATTEENNDDNDKVVCIGDSSIETQFYWWGTPNAIHSKVIAPEEGFDIILVSDCVLPKLYPIEPLVEAIHQLLNLSGGIAILSYEQRYYPDYDPSEKFRELCRARHLQVTVIPMAEQDPVYSTDDIEIWHVEREGTL